MEPGVAITYKQNLLGIWMSGALELGKGDTDATFLFCGGGVCGAFCLAGLDVEFFFCFGFCVCHFWGGGLAWGWLGGQGMWLVV